MRLCPVGLYLLSAGKGLGMLFYNLRFCLPKWSLIAAAILIPFAATAREMASLKSLVWINIATLCSTVLLPLGYYVFVGTEEIDTDGSHWYAVAPLTFTGVMSGLSTYAFGMTSQFMLTEIVAEMKNPEELPKAYTNISGPFQLVAFMAAGLGGYYFLGDKSAAMINENLPFNVTFRVAAGCLTIHMLITYLIKNVVFSTAIARTIREDWSHPDDTRKRSLSCWCGAVIFAVAAAWLLANLVPFFGDAVDLLGASVTPLSCWVIPILMFCRQYYDTEAEARPKVTAWEWICMALELLLALVLMVVGTRTTVGTIVEHWNTYGQPFDCHCEDIWNTCACSAAHVGMEMCQLLPGNVTH